jgi:predicted anti-sigma-YlaC factor YlaD
MTTSAHLTDDQFTECVIGAPNAESEAHLLTCADCRQELNRFNASVGDFSRATLAWSEAQPAVSLRAASLSQSRHPMFVHARWALAAVFLLIVGVPVVWHGNHSTTVPADTAAVSAAAPDDSDAQIAQDNQLMQSVNVAIGRAPSPFQEYGLQESRRVRLRSGPGSRSE